MFRFQKNFLLAGALLALSTGCSESEGDSSKGDQGSGDNLGGATSQGGAGNGASSDDSTGAGAGAQSSGTGASSNIGQACAASDQDARLSKANLLFVVDRSGSMLERVQAGSESGTWTPCLPQRSWWTVQSTSATTADFESCDHAA